MKIPIPLQNVNWWIRVSLHTRSLKRFVTNKASLERNYFLNHFCSSFGIRGTALHEPLGALLLAPPHNGVACLHKVVPTSHAEEAAASSPLAPAPVGAALSCRWWGLRTVCLLSEAHATPTNCLLGVWSQVRSHHPIPCLCFKIFGTAGSASFASGTDEVHWGTKFELVVSPWCGDVNFSKCFLR